MQGIIVLIVYALLMVGATKAFTKREDGGESFHVGHRNMGMVVSAMSIAATWIWAPALFTSAEKAYSNGIAGLFWFLVPNILCLILFIPFARKIRRDMPDGITLSGYMHKKYKSEPVKRVYLFQLTALTILSTAARHETGGNIPFIRVFQGGLLENDGTGEEKLFQSGIYNEEIMIKREIFVIAGECECFPLFVYPRNNIKADGREVNANTKKSKRGQEK